MLAGAANDNDETQQVQEVVEKVAAMSLSPPAVESPQVSTEEKREQYQAPAKRKRRRTKSENNEGEPENDMTASEEEDCNSLILFVLVCPAYDVSKHSCQSHSSPQEPREPEVSRQSQLKAMQGPGRGRGRSAARGRGRGGRGRGKKAQVENGEDGWWGDDEYWWVGWGDADDDWQEEERRTAWDEYAQKAGEAAKAELREQNAEGPKAKRRKQPNKEVPAASSKATPKAKAKAKGREKDDREPKAGKARAATGKSKAQKPQAKAKPKAKSSKNNAHEIEHKAAPTDTEGIRYELQEWLDKYKSLPGDEIKPALLPVYQRTVACSLNNYWTRPATGVKCLLSGKDFAYYHYTAMRVAKTVKTIISLKLGEILATWLLLFFFF